MTEVFYVAVKGSLHAGDSSVFGIKSEEYSALCRRFPDSNKPVINGVLIKGSPLEVINSLAELGYRVTCSSGETEIVWTLRREALPGEKLVSPLTSPQATPPLQVAGRPFVVQPAMTRAPVKTVERIGTKPEDWQEVYSDRDADRITTRHISSLERVDPGQKIILKTNLSSEFNPLSKRPGPLSPVDCLKLHHNGTPYPRKRSRSLPPFPTSRLGCKSGLYRPKYCETNSEGVDWVTPREPGSYKCYHVKGTNVILRKRKKTPMRREGLKIYLEDVYPSDYQNFTERNANSKKKVLFKPLSMPLTGNFHPIEECKNERSSLTFLEKRGCGDVEYPRESDLRSSPNSRYIISEVPFTEPGIKQSFCSEPSNRSTYTGSRMSVKDELISLLGKTYSHEQKHNNPRKVRGSKSDALNYEMFPNAMRDLSSDSKTGHYNQLDVLESIEYSVELINDSCGLLMKTEDSINGDEVQSPQSEVDWRTNSISCNNWKLPPSLESGNVANNFEAFTSKDIPTTFVASYSDLTMSGNSLRNSQNSRLPKSGCFTNCPHDSKHPDLSLTENKYPIKKSFVSSPPRNYDHPLFISSSSVRTPIKCERQYIPSGNSSIQITKSIKPLPRLSHTIDSSSISLPSTLGVLQQFQRDNADTDKLNQLDETDWSLISSLVDELFKNKRKRMKLRSFSHAD